MTAKAMTDLDDEECVLRYRQGMTERQLARHFGVSRAAIQRALDRCGVDRRPPGHNLVRADADTAEIVRLRDEGLTWEEVAERVGMRPGGVRRRYDTACRVT